MSQNNAPLGIGLMIATTFVFAMQDGISQHLAREYNVMMIVMIRYWFFAAFVIAIASRAKGGLRNAVRTEQPKLQIFRGALLCAEICVAVQGFVYLGLIESHAIFASYPLIIAALSGVVLGEQVGWRRWSAIGVGFIGMLIILQPGTGVFSPLALIPLMSALMFALYGLLTRYVARKDSAATSFFWTGASGAVFMTLAGFAFWEPLSPPDWLWMALLCMTGAGGHFLLIKTYEVAEASAVQPFAYLQLVWASSLGFVIFAEELRANIVIGASLIVSAGVFALLRERAKARAV
ncbi:DMT family transporter [Planktotalea sp.]|uniref:DMT family transporter n=1 Tax=Planktotalea sp. TaxID=2029877 RepID=UPI003D6ACE32